ncbi:MAG: histidine phosphatase family protein [Firmicutes bacterium]|nr:histidine phosphatase family protein [Bacillota bacterium]
MKSIVYLVRHGITEAYQKEYYYGGIDVPLVPEGVEEIKRLAAEGLYPDPSDAQVFTSGMLRAEETLFYMYGTETEHERITDLREQHYGIFEMKTHEEVCAMPESKLLFADKEGIYEIPGGGESRKAFFERLEEGWNKVVGFHRLKELSHRHSQLPAVTIVVCHGGVIDRIIHNLFGEHDEPRFKWIPEPGHGYSIEFENGDPVSFEKF